MEYTLADTKCNTKFGPVQTETGRFCEQYFGTITCIYF